MVIPEPLYYDIIRVMPIACVDVAIVSSGSVLLVKRNDEPAKGEWWLPGGRIYKGEMMREAALRKARQEVGIICHAGPIIYTAETVFDDGPNGIPVHSINSCFLLYPLDFEVKLDGHHSEFEWIRHISPNYHPYIKQCLNKVGIEEK